MSEITLSSRLEIATLLLNRQATDQAAKICEEVYQQGQQLIGGYEFLICSMWRELSVLFSRLGDQEKSLQCLLLADRALAGKEQ